MLELMYLLIWVSLGLLVLAMPFVLLYFWIGGLIERRKRRKMSDRTGAR